MTNGLFMKYFVLSPLKDNPYGKASRDAILEYAIRIQGHDPQLSHELNEWLYNINQQLDRINSKPNASEATEGAETPSDIPTAIEKTKVPESDESNGQDLIYESDGEYENAPEKCKVCGSINIMFLEHEGGIYPQWECHDCGEIFYDDRYSNSSRTLEEG